MRTTEPRFHTNIPVSKSGRCGGSDQSLRLNGSLRFTGKSRICSELAAIILRQPIIDCFGTVLSLVGER